MGINASRRAALERSMKTSGCSNKTQQKSRNHSRQCCLAQIPVCPLSWFSTKVSVTFFVTRVAGNVVTSEIIASLEQGAAVLGTKVILVMGHGNCGAVKATIQAKEVPGQISALYPHIQPAVDQAGSNLEAATKANAKIQAALLREASTVVAGLVKEGKLKVVAGYYDVSSGSVTLLE
jgi:hypothetical protein